MKSANLLPLGAALVALIYGFAAGASYERGMKQLRNQNHEAFTAAAEALDGREPIALEQFVRQAWQNSDDHAALGIREAMAAPPEAPSAMSLSSSLGDNSLGGIEKVRDGIWKLRPDNGEGWDFIASPNSTPSSKRVVRAP